MIGWLKGWWETLVIRVTQPELYAQLANKEDFDGDDFVEVERPE